jgi:hypothetical protein
VEGKGKKNAFLAQRMSFSREFFLFFAKKTELCALYVV